MNTYHFTLIKLLLISAQADEQPPLTPVTAILLVRMALSDGRLVIVAIEAVPVGRRPFLWVVVKKGFRHYTQFAIILIQFTPHTTQI